MLFRFDPFEEFDRANRQPALLAMDAVRDEDKVYVYFDAPGVDTEDIDITVEENGVTVEASRRWVGTDLQTLSSERAQGRFRRQIQLGENLDTDKLAARMDKGVLILEIPIKEGTKPRSIQIQSTESQQELRSSGS